MSLFNEPLYRLLRQTMGDNPRDEPYWKTVNERGLQAAEVANLVAIRKDNPPWQKFSAELQQAGLQLGRAAKSKDATETDNAYTSLIQRCNACHQAMASDHAPQLKP